jgi:hypothetical protein
MCFPVWHPNNFSYFYESGEHNNQITVVKESLEESNRIIFPRSQLIMLDLFTHLLWSLKDYLTKPYDIFSIGLSNNDFSIIRNIEEVMSMY